MSGWVDRGSRYIQAGRRRMQARCTHGDQNCTNPPTQGLRRGEAATHCIDHADWHMVYISKFECDHKDCHEIPTWALGGKRGKVCFDHRLPGMTNVRAGDCEINECPRKPLYNHPGCAGKIRCEDHRDAAMIEVNAGICVGVPARDGIEGYACPTQATAGWNIPGHKPQYCAECMDAAGNRTIMIDARNAKCFCDNCISYGTGPAPHFFCKKLADIEKHLASPNLAWTRRERLEEEHHRLSEEHRVIGMEIYTREVAIARTKLGWIRDMLVALGAQVDPAEDVMDAVLAGVGAMGIRARADNEESDDRND